MEDQKEMRKSALREVRFDQTDIADQGTDRIGIKKVPDEARATGNRRYHSDPHELRWTG
jgi:hypothetical protein